MLRRLLIPAVSTAIVLLGAADVLAAKWPAMDIRPGFRGPGFYLSWIKILACWLVFLTWVRSADWVNRDLQELKLNFRRWNPIVVGTFMAAFVLVWMIPYFWLGFPLLVIAFIGPLIGYVVFRNSQVDNNRRVFTPAHIRYWLSERLRPLGLKIAAEAIDKHERGPAVKVSARGGETERDDGARLLAARQHDGLLPARQIIADGLAARASAIMLDYAQQGAAVRYMIDAVWHNRETVERETADPALEALKILCGLDPQDRQGKQQGTFAAEYETIHYQGTLASQGTKTGERILLQFEDPKIRFETLADIGMRDKIQEHLKELLQLEKGILLLSAMPAAGLRTTTDVVLHQTDRFTREFMAIEEESDRYEQIENVEVVTYNAAKGETPAAVLPKVFRMDPHVLVCRELVDGETVGLLCREISAENRLVISTIRAKDCAEALLRVLALGVEADELAPAAAAVFGQRLVRKLCEKCKEAYAPTPQILKQLGIPEGRIKAFHRPPQQPEEVCEQCGGIGYRGRTAIFELLTVGETVRKVLKTKPKLDLLRRAARKDRMRSLQEEGILLVAKGVTSLPELMRVLKQ